MQSFGMQSFGILFNKDGEAMSWNTTAKRDLIPNVRTVTNNYIISRSLMEHRIEIEYPEDRFP